MEKTVRPSVEDYHIGWLCALSQEMAAARGMLDEDYGVIDHGNHHDHNSYRGGRVHQHNVVIACLPAGVDGTNAAATIARDMVRTFPALRFGLLVGIGGGIPNLEAHIDIRLGDVVVSQPSEIRGGVIQYDKGRKEDEGFVRKGILNSPPRVLLTALSHLQSEHDMVDSKVPSFLSEMLQRYPKMEETGYAFPGSEHDTLYQAACDSESADRPTKIRRTERRARHSADPMIHYGVIASGNSVIKNASERDGLQAQYGALCVEMEAAGLMNDFPCLVIRGICDYADSSKSDAWQKYAAATAAAYTKELLIYISAEGIRTEQTVQQILGALDGITEATKRHEAMQEMRYENDRQGQCHRMFRTCQYEEDKNKNPDRVEGTCHWILNHERYQSWYHKAQSGLLWISADPGCGKSVFCKYLADHELQVNSMDQVCYFFFKDVDQQDNLSNALCSLLHQLFSSQPHLLRHALRAYEKDGNNLKQNIEELWRILLAVTADPDANNTICVVDALDECCERDRVPWIRMLSEFYGHVFACQPVNPWLKFIVTSRRYYDIQNDFGRLIASFPTIHLVGEEESLRIQKEINLVIPKWVADLDYEFRLGEQKKKDIEEQLLNMEHRTYLWLYLVIDHIREVFKNSLRPHRESIMSLPSSVEDAYAKILGRVISEQEPQVKVILQVIVGARRPLTITEISMALGVATDPSPKQAAQTGLNPDLVERRIRDWCGLFVSIWSSKIYLIHQTAKEFLIMYDPTSASTGWKHCLQPMDTEIFMSKVCLVYLLLTDVGDTGSDMESNANDFLDYAAEHWATHVRDGRADEQKPLLAMISSLCDPASDRWSAWFKRCLHWDRSLFDERNLLAWVMGKPIRPCLSPNINRVLVAAINGHDEFLRLVVESEKPELDSEFGDKTPLMWAVSANREKAVHLLIESGADVNAGTCDSALSIASKNGHKDIVRYIVENGADVKIGRLGGDSPLVKASENGHEDIVHYLVDNGADVNLRGAHGLTPLLAASLNGHRNIVNYLLDNGAEVNITDEGFSPLILALRDGDAAFAEVLFSEVAEYIVGALRGTSGNGDVILIQRRLERGTTDLEGALQHAAYYGNTESAKILLEKGAKDLDGALHTASGGGNINMIQFLLERGATNLERALSGAAVNGKTESAKVLLEKGAKDLNTALLSASLSRSNPGNVERTIRYLIEKGASNLEEALRGARYSDNTRVMGVLLEKGAKDLDSPLMLTLEVGVGSRAITFLIEEGAEDPDLSSSDYMTD